MEQINKKITLEDIVDKIDLDKLRIYLRPMRKKGMKSTTSYIANVGDQTSEYPIDDFIEEISPVISRAWLEVVATVQATRDESGEICVLDIDDMDDYDYEDLEQHFVIGTLVGYIIDLQHYSMFKECDEASLAITFDCISQITSNLWCDMEEGDLGDITNLYEDGSLYFLNSINIHKDFETEKIKLAAIHLLESASELIYNTELMGIVYSLGTTDLFDTYFDENENLGNELYWRKEKQLLKNNNFYPVQSLAGYEYFVKTFTIETPSYFK